MAKDEKVRVQKVFIKVSPGLHVFLAIIISGVYRSFCNCLTISFKYIYIVIEFVCLPRLHTQLFPGCIPMFIDCSCLLITSFQLFFPYCYLITINDIHGLYHIYDHPKKRVPTASAHVLGKIT